ncbi:tyrosine-type recombinase/integrase [Rummeliibacillus stabekisii]|uniref:Tyr recombinase domain-containing protein n=1 Tax=Rummeliibacillus stabekisii TaxID=241244 RepID=A0A143HBW7_9BACL|nr:tyrosine-type recombinase/integrase [Rummeliibacillus stabekisii]AMW99243.1 hypothetical protein ATY39_07050 [Rummeliibacillus stabekisii]
MASVTKRGKRWQYSVSNYIDGVNKPIRKGGFRTKKEAQIAAAELEAKKNKGEIIIEKDIPFAEFFEKWVSTYKSSLHKNTLLRYSNSLNWIKVYFKDKPIQKITAFEYQEFLNWFGEGRSYASVEKLDKHAKACLTYAHDNGYISKNITKGRKLSASNKGKKPSEKHLNYNDSVKLYNYLINNLQHEFRNNYCLLLALVSGARFGELVGLIWNDFDFENNTININKTWDYKKQTGFEATKNEESIRVITIESNTMEKFQQLLSSTGENGDTLVFKSRTINGHSITNEGTNKKLSRILNDLGINQISPHGLRHTHASVLLYKGLTIYYVSERLGHKDIQTTLQSYTHVLDEMRERDDSKALKVFEEMNIYKNKNV